MYGLERGISWPGMEVRRRVEFVMGGGGRVLVTRGLICFAKDLGLYPTGSRGGSIGGP